MAYAVIVTFSRGGFIGLAFISLLIFKEIIKSNKIIGVILIMMCIVFTFSILPEGYTERITGIFDPSKDETGSAQQRLLILETGWEAFKRHPLVGSGLGTFEVIYHEVLNQPGEWKTAHNSYLQVLVETGILGFMAFTIFIYYGFKNLKTAKKYMAKERHNRDKCTLPNTAITYSLWGFLVGALFLSQAWGLHLYYLLGLAKTMSNLAEEKQAQVNLVKI